MAPGHQRQSEVVRDAVYRYTVAATGLRGNRAQPLAEQSLYVLNYTTMPATLIELGFMDSTTDTPIILTERFADEAAAGLAAALVEVYDLQPNGGGQVLMTAVPVSYTHLSMQVTKSEETAQETVTQAIRARVGAYLTEIALEAYRPVLAADHAYEASFARIGAAILEAPGVEDYTGLTVNGGTVNIRAASKQAAVLGEVVVRYAP